MRPINKTNKIFKFFSELIDKELKLKSNPLAKALTDIRNLQGEYSSSDKEYKVILPLLSDFKSFILKHPKDHQLSVDDWELNYKNLFYTINDKNLPVQTDFGKKIKSALHYSDFRRKYAKHYYKLTDVKTCPYCNSTLTVVVRSGNSKTARFQLDHFFPKVKYPLLSVSIFNLIPSCANCNQSKSSGDVKIGKDFHLYADETPMDGINFHIPEDSKTKYRLSNNIEDIELKFVEGKDSDEAYAKNHDKSYGILKLYNTQKDIIEELFWKQKAYTPARIKELADLLKIKESQIKRMVVGNYISQGEIHKRPLAKFTQDISRDLKLIK